MPNLGKLGDDGGEKGKAHEDTYLALKTHQIKEIQKAFGCNHIHHKPIQYFILMQKFQE